MTMELLRASTILFTTHLRRIAFSRRTLACLALCLVPVVAALMVVRVVEMHGESTPGAIDAKETADKMRAKYSPPAATGGQEKKGG